MPTYEYMHEDESVECPLGDRFCRKQSMKDDALAECPECGRAVFRVVGKTYVSSPHGDSDLRDKGFTKLVRRDKGVYENVTRLGGESRFVEADKPGTLPDLKKRGLD